MLSKAIEITKTADILLIIGTSMQVYPAAGLIQYAKDNIPIYFVNPNTDFKTKGNVTLVLEKATIGVPILVNQLLD